MKRTCDFGFLLPLLLCTAGIYTLLQTIDHTEWYMDIILVVGATISTMGLVMLCWTARRRFSIRRLEHHVRGHH